MSDTNTVSALIAQLQSEDIQFKLEAICNLTTIAKLLGTERTRDELISYLAGLYSFLLTYIFHLIILHFYLQFMLRMC